MVEMTTTTSKTFNFLSDRISPLNDDNDPDVNYFDDIKAWFTLRV